MEIVNLKFWCFIIIYLNVVVIKTTFLADNYDAITCSILVIIRFVFKTKAMSEHNGNKKATKRKNKEGKLDSCLLFLWYKAYEIAST